MSCWRYLLRFSFVPLDGEELRARRRRRPKVLGIESPLTALDPYGQVVHRRRRRTERKAPPARRVWITMLHFPLTGSGSFSHRSVLVRRIFTEFTRMAEGWSEIGRASCRERVYR